MATDISPQVAPRVFPSSTMSLPVELLDLIFPHCAKGELYHISLACRLFSSITRPLLYKDITLDHPASIDLLLTLYCSRSSRISGLVQSLRIVVLGESMWKRLSNKQMDKYIHLTHGPESIAIYEILGYSGPERYYQTLNGALSRLRQLKQLDIEIHGAVSPKLQLNLTERLFEGCIFNLRSFKTNLAVDAGLAKFLRAQPYLKSLRLMHNTKDQASHFPGHRHSISDLYRSAPALSHPSLRTLTVSDLLPQSTINYIYKFGRVREFNVLFLNPTSKRDYLPPCLKKPLVKGKYVKNLAVTYLNQLVPGHFEVMASFMPNVQSLEIRVCVLTKDTLEQMGAALEKFPALQNIHLHSYSFPGPYTAEGAKKIISDHRKVFRGWFRGCSNLNDIWLPQYNHHMSRAITTP